MDWNLSKVLENTGVRAYVWCDFFPWCLYLWRPLIVYSFLSKLKWMFYYYVIWTKCAAAGNAKINTGEHINLYASIWYGTIEMSWKFSSINSGIYWNFISLLLFDRCCRSNASWGSPSLDSSFVINSTLPQNDSLNFGSHNSSKVAYSPTDEPLEVTNHWPRFLTPTYVRISIGVDDEFINLNIIW